jgi:hypothetical protein
MAEAIFRLRMSRSLSPCPAEVQVERLLAKADHIVLTLRAIRRTAACPRGLGEDVLHQKCGRPQIRVPKSQDAFGVLPSFFSGNLRHSAR